MGVQIRIDHKVCYGCTREGVVWSATGYKCPVWADQSKVYSVRQGECPFNKRERKIKKAVTKGQQKQGRNR